MSLIKPGQNKDLLSLNILQSILFVFAFIVCIFFITTSAAMATSAPAQPLEGPGGADYIHNKVISNNYGYDVLQYYLFEPDSPKPDTAPLILFLHGCGITNPATYSAWIEHIVKKGNIVVFPIYQSILTSFKQFTANSIQAVSDSIEELKKENHVRPDLDKFAIVGHSIGGILTVNMAALAVKASLPIPLAIMSVQPGRSLVLPLEDLSLIPSHTLLLTVVGDQDSIAGDEDAKNIFLGTPQIPLENKNFIIMISDKHGSPSLKADHFAPFGTTSDADSQDYPTDTLDYYCLWKLFEALTDAAFYGENWEYALDNAPQQRYMGKWSDGVPVKELIVTDLP